ncbi:hypothetical protein COL32_26400 [Bacillus pseudomycoides]|uniref:hypothetical protein n=1 Tax=Bacillus pseudomycoides TaxID=64104 RepID=UPI000BF912D4|nr:hypothetical protein [Bacillus pseudomycoides]PFW97403.1 hypothetical protein COL29_03655 [Bacillus pseudomycoides]PFX37892.1 hypothetical protein COL32_26400 [Bacillus pseudomycoides]
MAYIDADYYNNEYKGTPVADGWLLGRLIARASDQIDHIINYKLEGVDFDKLAPFIKKQVQKATAAQVEFLAINGETSATVSEGGGGFSVGSYSEDGVSAGDNNTSNFYTQYAISVTKFLRPTGLLYAGVCVHG